VKETVTRQTKFWCTRAWGEQKTAVRNIPFELSKKKKKESDTGGGTRKSAYNSRYLGA